MARKQPNPPWVYYAIAVAAAVLVFALLVPTLLGWLYGGKYGPP